jgi:hypothetical protein
MLRRRQTAPAIAFELVDWMADALKEKSEHRRPAEESRSLPEQTGSVATPSQLPIITRLALPRSNQIHATMFGLLFDNDNGDHRL